MGARGRPARVTIYARLEHLLGELNHRLGGLPSPKESVYIWSDIWHLEAHHSTALEGNTLVLREVEALLEQGRAVGAKPLKEYMEVKGYADAARWIYGQALNPGGWTDAGKLTVHELRHTHHLALTPVWGISPHPDATAAESPGSFREHDIHPFAEGMTPPSWILVQSQVDSWVDDVNAAQAVIAAGGALPEPLPETLARLHNSLEQIHPFLDGNGRAGRLILNLMLVRMGYPPVIILKRNREEYLRALRRSDAGEHGPLGELLARAMIDNLHRFILPSVAGPARLVPIAALVNHDLKLPALRAAVRRGRLDAEQDSQGQWLSSRAAVDAYLKSRSSRGRRRSDG